MTAKKTYTMPHSQEAFIGGVLSGSLYGRVDIDKFSYGLKRCENFFVHAHGGISNRTGTQFLNYLKYQDKDARPVTFQFNTEQAYILEFGDQYMRVWKDGGLVLAQSTAFSEVGSTEGTAYTIACTAASPAVFSTVGGSACPFAAAQRITTLSITSGSALAVGDSFTVTTVATPISIAGVAYTTTTVAAIFTFTAHGLSTGDLVYASGFTGFNSHNVNSKMWRVVKIDANTFNLYDYAGVAWIAGDDAADGSAGQIQRNQFTLTNLVTGALEVTTGELGSGDWCAQTMATYTIGFVATAQASARFALDRSNTSNYSDGDILMVTNQFGGTAGRDVLTDGSRWRVSGRTAPTFTTAAVDAVSSSPTPTKIKILTASLGGLATGDIVWFGGGSAGAGRSELLGRSWYLGNSDVSGSYTRFQLIKLDFSDYFYSGAGSVITGLDIYKPEMFYLYGELSGVICNLAGKTLAEGGAFTQQNTATISAANPAVATTTDPHGLTSGDWVLFSSATGTIGNAVNGVYLKAVVLTANTFSLTDLFDVAIDTSLLSGGLAASINAIYEIDTPYIEDDLPRLNFTQSADTMVITSLDYDSVVLTRTAHDAWSMTDYVPAPVALPPTNLTAVKDGTGLAKGTFSYKICTVLKGSYEESCPASISAEGWMQNGNITSAGSYSWFSQMLLTWTAAANAARYNVYRSVAGSEFSYIGSVNQPATGNVAFADVVPLATSSSVARLDPPPPDIATNPFLVNGVANNPACAAYHEQRLWFGGSDTNPQTLWATQIANYYNMNRNPPVSAEDAIVMTIPSNQVNDIRSMVSMKDLLLLTGGGLFVVDSTTGAISAATVRANQNSFASASATVAPLTVDRNVIYVEDRGVGLRDIDYSQDRGYAGKDLTLLARHLFENKEITSLSYQKIPDSLLYVTTRDGFMYTLTYVKEQDVFAWAVHTASADGVDEFNYVAVIPEGQRDSVYIAMTRSVGGKIVRSMERLRPRMYAQAQDAVFLDCSISYDEPFEVESIGYGASTTITTREPNGLTAGDLIEWDVAYLNHAGVAQLPYKVGTVSTPYTFVLLQTNGDPVNSAWAAAFEVFGYIRKKVATVTGLDHLVDEEVTIVADGVVIAQDHTLASASYTLPNSAKAARIHIGLPYTSTATTLDGEMSLSMKGKISSNVRAVIRFKDTAGGQVGVDDADLIDITELGSAYATLAAPISAEVEQVLHSNWQNTTSITIVQSDPAPMTVLSLSVDTGVSD